MANAFKIADSFRDEAQVSVAKKIECCEHIVFILFENNYTQFVTVKHMIYICKA
jgi:hypothetical protein